MQRLFGRLIFRYRLHLSLSSSLPLSLSPSLPVSLSLPLPFLGLFCASWELKAVNESNKFHGFGNVETAIRARGGTERLKMFRERIIGRVVRVSWTFFALTSQRSGTGRDKLSRARENPLARELLLLNFYALFVSVLIVGPSYGARTVLSYTCNAKCPSIQSYHPIKTLAFSLRIVRTGFSPSSISQA